MKARIVIAVACLLLGGLAGNFIARYGALGHEHTRSVMGLEQFHVERLAEAARTGHCQRYAQERDRLLQLQDELIEAFPLAYAQDADFHTRADALGSAVQNAHVEAAACPAASLKVKPIREACNACHRL